MARERTVAVFLAVLVGAVLWIEHGNRTAIEPPQQTGPCADSDAVPYNARCIEFMMGPGLPRRPE